MPLPSSETEIATCAPSRAASTRIGDVSGAWRAALANRLFSTWAMRSRSAIAIGRPGGSSASTVCRLPPLANVVRARSTSEATLVGSGATVSVPASMLPASSRSATRPRMWLACPSMSRKNSIISARDARPVASSTVPAEP